MLSKQDVECHKIYNRFYDENERTHMLDVQFHPPREQPMNNGQQSFDQLGFTTLLVQEYRTGICFVVVCRVIHCF